MARLNALRAAINPLPPSSTWILHGPIPLKSRTQTSAALEVAEILQRVNPKEEWFVTIAATDDGTRHALASDLYERVPNPSEEDLVKFLMFDLHTRLSAWYLTHTWRALDLAEATVESLEQWRIIPAAASSRALLEGVAAFVVELQRVLEEWMEFKSQGQPTIDSVGSFRRQIGARIDQAQFGSRIGSPEQGSPRFRPNVMTFLKNFGKLRGRDYMDMYEWLSDAIHASFGFGTTYVATQGKRDSTSTVIAHIARQPYDIDLPGPSIHPTVAWASADAFTLSTDEFLTAHTKGLWMIADWGLVIGLERVRADYFGKINTPSRNEPCPCGSGKKSKSCMHRWGDTSAPDLLQA